MTLHLLHYFLLLNLLYLLQGWANLGFKKNEPTWVFWVLKKKFFEEKQDFVLFFNTLRAGVRYIRTLISA